MPLVASDESWVRTERWISPQCRSRFDAQLIGEHDPCSPKRPSHVGRSTGLVQHAHQETTLAPGTGGYPRRLPSRRCSERPDHAHQLRLGIFLDHQRPQFQQSLYLTSGHGGFWHILIGLAAEHCPRLAERLDGDLRIAMRIRIPNLFDESCDLIGVDINECWIQPVVTTTFDDRRGADCGAAWQCVPALTFVPTAADCLATAPRPRCPRALARRAEQPRQPGPYARGR